MIFCSYTGITVWLQNHLLACPFKKLTGYDCPGCGFQRSLIALLQGNFQKSLHYYPATIPLIVLAVFAILGKRLPVSKTGYAYLKNSLCIFTGFLIISSYMLKMSGHGLHLAFSGNGIIIIQYYL